MTPNQANRTAENMAFEMFQHNSSDWISLESMQQLKLLRMDILSSKYPDCGARLKDSPFFIPAVERSSRNDSHQ
jgi:hypothetical protein